MFFRIKMIYWLVFMFLVANAMATNLVQSYQKALTYNANYLADISSNKASLEQQRQALASLLPQVSGNANVKEIYSYTQFELLYHQPAVGVNLQQVVFDFNKFSNYSKQKYGSQVANLRLLDAKQNLMLNTVQSYFDTLYAADSLRDTALAESALNQQYKQTEKSFHAGIMNIADVNDAKAGYYAAVSNVIQGQNDLDNKKLIYHNITGLNPDDIEPLKETITITGNKLQVQPYIDLAMHNNNTIKIAELQLSMASEDISMARANHYPTLNLVANYQYQGDSRLDGGSESARYFFEQQRAIGFQGHNQNGYVGLQLNLPIYSGGAVSSQSRVAMANYEVAKQQLIAAKRQVTEQVQSAALQVKRGLNLLTAQKEALASAELKVKSDRIAYKAGLRTSLDLVNAQLDRVKAIQSYNQARYQYLMAKLQLQYLTGNLDMNYLMALDSNIS